MSDIADDCLSTSEAANCDPRSDRRQTMKTLMRLLVELSSQPMDADDMTHGAAVTDLTEIIADMAGRIAVADDVMFSAIMTDATMLIASLQRREADMAGATLH